MSSTVELVLRAVLFELVWVGAIRTLLDLSFDIVNWFVPLFAHVVHFNKGYICIPFE